MNLFDADRWEEIWVTITRNKVRSLLTGFGVFWGIFMLVIMMGAGTGLERGVTKNFEGFATNSCIIGTNRTSEPYKGFKKGRNWDMHNRDLEILIRSIPEIEVLSPLLFGGGGSNNVFYNENSGSFGVRGVHANYKYIEEPNISQGRFINETDVAQKRKVCVIGTETYTTLFPKGDSPIEKYIRVNGIYYQVVGVMSGIANLNIGVETTKSVNIPFTTLQQIQNEGDIVHILMATAKPHASAKSVQERIETVLKASNDISPTDKQAVWGFSLENEFKKINIAFLAIAIVTWIVGSGTLIAGIVSVSNIMLVTIKERTKEIGIRRALGAKPVTIVSQIMSESLILTAIAGMLGLTLGVLTLYLADTYWLQKAENVFLSDPIVSFGTAVSSTIILLICGLIAGAIPTMRALQVKAIDAIREE